MEILFWTQPLFSLFCFFGGLFGFLGFASFSIMFVVDKVEETRDEEGLFPKNFCGKMVKLSACVLAIVILVSPLANVKEIYKNILIYRGLNSALVDKAANTADKMLNVLNEKLDAELEK